MVTAVTVISKESHENADRTEASITCISRASLRNLGFEPLAELTREGFTGAVAELHTPLDSMVSDAMRRSVRWPKGPNGLP